MIVEFTHFEAAFQKVTGVAVAECFFGFQCIPFRYNHFRIPVENDVIFQFDTFCRDDTFSEKPDLVHGGSSLKYEEIRNSVVICN